MAKPIDKEYLKKALKNFDEEILGNKYLQEKDTKVQADWNETDTASEAFIKNKPEIISEERVTALETPTFTQATTRANIASGESTKTILGKIKKYFTDLKTHAFNTPANNLTTTTTGYALDARQGKVLNDKVTAIEGNYAKKSIYDDTAVSMGRKVGTTIGTNSFAYGLDVEASGNYSHSKGAYTTASGISSTAEGEETIASGHHSHAEGFKTIASGIDSHAEGCGTAAIGWASHAEGNSSNKATDYVNSSSTNAEIIAAWIVNYFSLATVNSHTEGFNCLSLGSYGSHAEGSHTIASGAASHAEGELTKSEGNYSHAEGYKTQAINYISHAEGVGTIALQCQHAQGHFNNTTNAIANSIEGTSTGTAFVIGNGTESSRSNAFRVTGEGVVYATNAAIQTGADYAEYFEWADGNPNEEDRVGYFVTFDEDSQEKIRIANEDDYILGIVSGMPSVIGNGDECWKQRYVLDDFGRYIEETFEYEVVVGFDDDGNEIKETKNGTKWKENPEYDQMQSYIPRAERAEWSAIGMVGVLSVYDDGTCQVNGYCKCTNNGIATATEERSGYRVIKRVTDNIIKVVLK